jgi:pimeloyl-ACP methyl ester carboxylesterase
MKEQILQLKGATLYYETRGSGPVLLLIAGGAADAGVFEDVARVLAHDYTVVTYDPRGNSRSPLKGPSEDQQIEVHSGDAQVGRWSRAGPCRTAAWHLRAPACSGDHEED